MKKLYSFKSKLMILFAFSILIPIVFSILFFFKYLTNMIAKQNNLAYTNTVSSISSNINTYLDDLKRLTLTPYIYREIFTYCDYLSTNPEDRTINNINVYSLEKTYSATLNKIINASRTDILAISFIPANNPSVSYCVSKYYDTLSVMTTPSGINSWVDSTYKADGLTYFPPVHTVEYPKTNSQTRVFSLMRVIKDLDTNKIIGYIKVDAEESTLREIFSTIATTKNSKFLLLDENNQIIYSTKSDTTNDFVSQIYDKERDKFTSPRFDLIEKEITTSGWRLLYLGSKQDLYENIIFSFLVILVVGILFFIVSIMLFKSKAQSMVDSMYQIQLTLEKLDTGDLTVTSNVTGNAEFDSISKSINKTVNKLNRHIKNEYEAIIKQKQAEYIALQTQINPHFLNNILNGFVTLNRLNEKKLLEESIIQLADFYRYTCKNSVVSSLKDEFNCVDKYLTLQKLRFEDVFEYRLSLGIDTGNIKIPKLILQPLVENSIKHGISYLEEPMLIEVSSTVDVIENNPVLVLVIKDNGKGFDTSNTSSTQSTGILNIKERLSLFEKDSSLTIESEIGIGTTCKIILPLKESNQNEDIIS